MFIYPVGEPLGFEHAVGLKCLPSAFHRIKRGVKDDAMGVELGVEFPAGFMPEAGDYQIAG